MIHQKHHSRLSEYKKCQVYNPQGRDRDQDYLGNQDYLDYLGNLGNQDYLDYLGNLGNQDYLGNRDYLENLDHQGQDQKVNNNNAI